MDQSKRTPSQAGIIGAGIAGLSAAISLRRAGWQVEIFERSEFKNEVGAAITITPNAIAAFDRWGFDLHEAQAVPGQRFHIRLAANLQEIFKEDYPDLEEKFGHGAWTFHRVDLHRALVKLATKDVSQGSQGTPVSIQLGHEVVTVDCEQGQLTFRDGSTSRKDLVIIADGAHTNLLSHFTGKPTSSRKNGRSLFRILIPMDRVLSDPDISRFFENQLPGMVAFVDPVNDVFFISYPCRNQTILNTAVVHNTRLEDGEEDTWALPSSVEEVLEVTKDFHPSLKKFFLMVNDEDVKIHHLPERFPIDSLVRGRTLILGDAAYAMLPTLAHAASVTIESAATLEVLFQGVNGKDAKVVTERLAMFDQLCLPRCNMTMIFSNGGHGGFADPNVRAQVAKYYPGPLPPPTSTTWDASWRKFLFDYNSFGKAENLLQEHKMSVGE